MATTPGTRLHEPAVGTGTGAELAGDSAGIPPRPQLCALRRHCTLGVGSADGADGAAVLAAVFRARGGSLSFRPPLGPPWGALSALSSREKGLSAAGLRAAGVVTRCANGLSAAWATWNPSILKLPEREEDGPSSMLAFLYISLLSHVRNSADIKLA